MIGSLKGTIAVLEQAGESTLECIVDVHGVGYRVLLSPGHGADLGPIGAPVSLAVHTYVREGAITLYGFLDIEERKMFEVLLNAHGVGPSLALSILGAHSPSALVDVVASGDVDALMIVPGVGRKTAQRLLVELGQRFEMSANKLPDLRPHEPSTGSLARSELRAALVELGYGSEEIRIALEASKGQGSVEELLRDALRELAPRP
jgi:holliday junction DNA helicase RuvA